MGKESLIKSTTKPETTANSEEGNEKAAQSAAKKPVAKKPAAKTKAREKTAAAKKTAAKKPAAKTKTSTRKKPPAKAKTTASKKPAVKAKTTTAKKTAATSKSTVTSKKSTTPKAKAAAKAVPEAPPQKAEPKVEAAKPVSEPVEPEKKAAPKKAAQIPETPVPAAQLPPSDQPPADPANRMMQFGLAGFVLLVLLVIIASWMNTQNYYIIPGDGAIEIWQGKFAPKGEQLLMSIPGVAAPEPLKESYTQKEVYPIFYQYYLEKADTLLEVPGMPDFEGVKSYLNSAQGYATTSQMKAVVKSRSNAITRMVLLYKADVAASKDTPEDLKTAISLYKEARGYAADEGEAARIKRTIDTVDRRLDKLKSAAALEKKKQKSK